MLPPNDSNICVRELNKETHIVVPYFTETGKRKSILITKITSEDINISYTGILDEAGQVALKDGLKVVALLQKYNQIKYID